MVDFYVHESEIPEHIGFCYILPSNMRDTAGTCNMPISGKRQQPIGQLSGEFLNHFLFFNLFQNNEYRNNLLNKHSVVFN